ENRTDARGYYLCRQGLEVELQAAGKNSHRNFLRIRGRKDELHVLGRFLQRLQHRVERLLGEHVYFVDQINLVPPHGGRITRVVEDLAHVVDAGVRGGIELEQIDKATGVDVGTRRADSAGRRRHPLHAIEA